MTGFSFNGVHSSIFGLYYIPNADDRWFADPEYDVHDIDVAWKNGGYYFDSKVKNRTFKIKCFFEEIDLATRQRIKQWLKRGTRGILVFDDMPFVYWNVVPGKVPVGNWYLDTGDTHSGTVTITFTAYEPFGYLTRKGNGNYDYDDNSEAYCRFIKLSEMPADPTTASTSFDIYNPGTEDCGLSIDVSGTSTNPIRFYNETNGTYCEFNSIPSAFHVSIDGDTGFVSIYANGSTRRNSGFEYHDKGIVKLSPNEGFSDVQFAYEGLIGQEHALSLIGTIVSKEMIGGIVKIAGLNNTSLEIASVNISSNRLYCTKTGNGAIPETGTCSMKTTNHILIQEKDGNYWDEPSTLSLSSISVDYIPRIS